MHSTVDTLGERVHAAAELIVSLRTKILSLERELETNRTAPPPAPPPPASPDPSLAAELERLRTERVLVREGIRGILREIDRVSW